MSWGSMRAQKLVLAMGITMLWPTVLEAQARHSLTVSRHATVAFTDQQSDSIFAAATSALQTDDDFAPGTGDVSCSVVLARSSSVRTFSSAATPSTISSQADFSAVLAEPAYVKLLRAISWCGAAGSFAGCATSGGSMAVVAGGNWRGLVWAHEYGHTAGLPHRGANRELMTALPLAGDQNFVNQSECDRFVGGPSVSGGLFGAPIPRAGETSLQAIDKLLSSVFVDSIPYGLISRYPATVLPRVRAVLVDPARREDWPNALTVLGILGTPADAARVRSFVASGPDRRTPADLAYRARISAIFALGYALNRRADVPASRLLVALAEWKTSDLMPALRATSADDRLGYRAAARWALALTGRPGDAAVLNLAPVPGLVDEMALRETAQTVWRIGLARYYEGKLD